MKGYKIVLNGQNFFLEMQGKTQKMGFYATRFVEASSNNEAQEKAMQTIINDDKLKAKIKNQSNDPPKIFVEEIVESTITEEDKSMNAAFMFYKDES